MPDIESAVSLSESLSAESTGLTTNILLTVRSPLRVPVEPGIHGHGERAAVRLTECRRIVTDILPRQKYRHMLKAVVRRHRAVECQIQG